MTEGPDPKFVACAGIKVNDPKYIEGIETTLEAAGNALS
jgi:hypothetical protein